MQIWLMSKENHFLPVISRQNAKKEQLKRRKTELTPTMLTDSIAMERCYVYVTNVTRRLPWRNYLSWRHLISIEPNVKCLYAN